MYIPASSRRARLRQPQAVGVQCLSWRVFKKKRQVGAGRDVTYEKSDVDSTDRKEWSMQWNQFVLKPGDQQGFCLKKISMLKSFAAEPDKSEPDQSGYRSRLVARGDLGKNGARGLADSSAASWRCSSASSFRIRLERRS